MSLESLPSHLHNRRRAEQNEKSTTLLKSSRDLRQRNRVSAHCGSSPAPEIACEARTNTEKHKLQLTGGQCELIQELKTPEGAPHFSQFYLQEPYKVLTVKIQNKSAGRRRGKVAILKQAQVFCSS